jgi:steroid delta-isomerase-like uncharacterized protein
MTRSLTLFLLCGFLAGPGFADESSENKEVVLTMAEAINERDFDALDALVAQDVRRHSAATPEVKVENLEQFKSFLEQDLATCPDARQTVNMILAEGDMVAVHATYVGTQSGPMGPFPPTGKRVEIPFIGILRLENGKVAEIWVEWDNLSALTQLGHFPPGGEAKLPGAAKQEGN